MDVNVQQATLVALLLGTVRATGFVLVAPPFAGSSLPAPVRAAFALALSLVLVPHIRPDLPDITVGYLLVTTFTEIIIGAALGFTVFVLFTAVQVAGDLIDLAGGFSLQPAFDPLAMTTHSTIGKLHYLLATTLLFTSGGHLLLVSGFVQSYTALPVGAAVPTGHLSTILVSALSLMFLSAVQIAGPMIAVLLLADVGLALLNRAAPSLNVFTLGYPVKIMITLTLLGLSFPLLPAAVAALLTHASHAMVSLGVGGG